MSEKQQRSQPVKEPAFTAERDNPFKEKPVPTIADTSAKTTIVDATQMNHIRPWLEQAADTGRISMEDQIDLWEAISSQDERLKDLFVPHLGFIDKRDMVPLEELAAKDTLTLADVARIYRALRGHKSILLKKAPPRKRGTPVLSKHLSGRTKRTVKDIIEEQREPERRGRRAERTRDRRRSKSRDRSRTREKSPARRGGKKGAGLEPAPKPKLRRILV